jgi:hypothetical protein
MRWSIAQSFLDSVLTNRWSKRSPIKARLKKGIEQTYFRFDAVRVRLDDSGTMTVYLQWEGEDVAFLTSPTAVNRGDSLTILPLHGKVPFTLQSI